ALMWIRLNYFGLKALMDLDSSQYIIVNYQNLILNQKIELQRIFSFLDLKEKHKVVEDRIASQTVKVINTTTKGNPIEKWKSQLSEEEQNRINTVIEENQEKYETILNILSDKSK